MLFRSCAEEITLLPDGRFCQAEITSCGLNGGPLEAKGTYSAMIACHLYNSRTTFTDAVKKDDCPYLTNEADTRFAANITDGTRVGFKYFDFDGKVKLSAVVRGDGVGFLFIRTEDALLGALKITPSTDWRNTSASVTAYGKQALYLDYEGTGSLELLEIHFS